MREIIQTDEAPAALGPYSQGMRLGDLLFCSGQVALHPDSGELVKLDAPGQTRQCLENLDAVCRAAGGRLADAVRCTVYLTDMNDWGRVNEVYAEFLGDAPPARVAIQVVGLPKGAAVEIDAVVALTGAAE